MPYACEGKLIPKDKDRRVKLTDADREEIKRLAGTMSQQRLAKQFKVSRRLISFILHPEQHKENLKRRAERGGSTQYYNRERHTKAIREHRRYKKKLADAGELVSR